MNYYFILYFMRQKGNSFKIDKTCYASSLGSCLSAHKRTTAKIDDVPCLTPIHRHSSSHVFTSCFTRYKRSQLALPHPLLRGLMYIRTPSFQLVSDCGTNCLSAQSHPQPKTPSRDSWPPWMCRQFFF